jgi:uncharacterized protein (DUF2267 family)
VCCTAAVFQVLQQLPTAVAACQHNVLPQVLRRCFATTKQHSKPKLKPYSNSNNQAFDPALLHLHSQPSMRCM